MLAYQWLRLLLHCALRRRARFRLSYLRRLVLYLQIPGSREMGPGDLLAYWVVELAGTDSWRRINGVWMRSTVVGGSEHELGFQRIYPDGQADCWSHGREHDISWRAQQPEYLRAGENHKNLCDLPCGCPARLHDHPPRSLQQ